MFRRLAARSGFFHSRPFQTRAFGSLTSTSMQQVLGHYFGARKAGVIALLEECRIRPIREISKPSEASEWLKSAVGGYANPVGAKIPDVNGMQMPLVSYLDFLDVCEAAFKLGLYEGIGNVISGKYDLVIPDQAGLDDERGGFLACLRKHKLPRSILITGTRERIKPLNGCLVEARRWIDSAKVISHLNLINFKDETNPVLQQFDIAKQVFACFDSDNIVVLLQQPTAFWLREIYEAEAALANKQVSFIGTGISKPTARQCLNAVACQIEMYYPFLQKEYEKQERARLRF